MRVTVRLHAVLRKHHPESKRHLPFDVNLPAGSDIIALVGELGVPEGMVWAASVNAEAADLDHELHDGDSVSLFPPVAGGDDSLRLRVFISGVMQGSRQDHDVDSQDYRQQIAAALLALRLDVEILDPWAMYPGAVDYSPQQAKATLMEEIALAGKCDLLIAYLPHASMGTALEMWAAYDAGVPVVSISPMASNWVLLSLSSEIYPTLEEFLTGLSAGQLDKYLSGKGAAGV